MQKRVKQLKPNSRKVRSKYKEVTTIRMKVHKGMVIVLQDYAIHAFKIKKDIETGSDILEFQYHKMGNGQRKRANESEWLVKENVQGSLYLEKASPKKE